MTAAPALTDELRRLVLEVEDDLRVRLADDDERLTRWTGEHAAALDAARTSASWEAWRDERVTQSAVAWVLTTVFVRFCEDNRLVTPVWIAGDGDRAQEALDAELNYFRSNPEDSHREWTLQAVRHLQSLRATAALVESHSPLWQLQPSGKMAQRVLDFWRETGPDGKILRNLTDPSWSTRFLGDLYQDLSEHAKKTYALLQTPEFVEEFILDQTLTPALLERPLEGFTLIDPTCGSGHFLLGAFQRMLDAWANHAPGLDNRTRVQKALDAIHGVDLNPFAVAISRFRLTVAALKADGSSTLEQAPGFDFHLAAGDSLLFGKATSSLPVRGFDLDASSTGFAYSSEDRELLESILAGNQYDAVIGNPPYIKAGDKTLNERYRGLYKSCHGPYTLAVPFIERLFDLAKHGINGAIAGWTGQITSNGFMKRGYGTKIIEDYLARQDLRLVVDTSGAYIPGHGTPTVILVGRHQRSLASTVRTVLGVRGEPGRPVDPKRGLVWQSIIGNFDVPGHSDSWVSVVDLPSRTLAKHPWSLTGGGTSKLQEHLNRPATRLRARIDPGIGRAVRMGSDEAFQRNRVEELPSFIRNRCRPFLAGEDVRDYSAVGRTIVLYPYVNGRAAGGRLPEYLWPLRTLLGERSTFQGNMGDANREWWEYMQHTPSAYNTPLSITFSNVSTHNHFALNRGDTIFSSHAPVIKLPEGASEEEHLALLGVLNSSTACFWLKQNSHNKGNGGIGGGIGDEDWEPRYEFTGTTLQDFPLPGSLPLERGKAIDELAQWKADVSPSRVVEAWLPNAETLSRSRKEYDSLLGQMITEQEELDWEVYRLYGLIDEDLTYTGQAPELSLGERSFELALARKVEAGEEDTAWFQRHGSTPITEIPSHWPADYQALVQRRLDLIESNPNIRLLEKPEFKRRWATEPWEKQQERALRHWLLDRLEDRKFWFDANGRPQTRSISQLADTVGRDADLIRALDLWAESKDVDVVKALTTLFVDESVPYLAAQRLKESGLRKRQAWENTWDLQRREDAGEDVGKIPVPPKYTNPDFRKQSWWQARGKLDVPKERFILYPHAGRATDPTLLLGWAGWNHAEQFLALATIEDQRLDEAADSDTVLPLVAGMAEVLPWVQQWHQDVDPAYGTSMAAFCAEQLEQRRSALGVTTQHLADWRPLAAVRGRRAMKKENA